MHVAAPCRLRPRKDYTQGKEHVSLHTGRSWVILWHGCFKTAWDSSLVVSTVNGKVTGDVTSIFCHSVTFFGTDQCCWDGNHMPGWFMNVGQYVLVNVQLVIWFQSCLSHETLAHLQPAPCCALQVASQKLRRKKGRTSRFTLEHVGWFPATRNNFHHTFCWSEDWGQWNGDQIFSGTGHLMS